MQYKLSYRRWSWQMWYSVKRLGSCAYKLTAFLIIALLLGALFIATRGVHTTTDEDDQFHIGLGSQHLTDDEVKFSLCDEKFIKRQRLKGPLLYDDEYIINVFRDEYLVPPSTQEYRLETSAKYIEYMTLNSWIFLRSRVKAVLGRTARGFFVEAGALDGQYLSNSLPLERELQWTGLLVEANPRSYQKMLTKNRKAWLSPACLSPAKFPQEMILNMMEMMNARSSYDYPWIARGSSHLEETAGGDQEIIQTQFHTTYARVQCFPLATMLLALNVTHIDLLSLDVEGGEPDILRSLPWSQLTVSVMLVEHHGESSSRDEGFLNFITDKGFRVFDYQTDNEGITDYVFVSDKYWQEHGAEILKRSTNFTRAES